MLFYLYFVCVFCCYVAAKNEEYRGYKVYNIKLNSQNQQENLDLLKSDLIDFWRKPSFQYGVVGKAMVPPSHFNWFEGTLEKMGIDKDVYIEDVYEFLTKEESRTKSSKTNVDPESGEFDIKSYHKYDDILTYLRTLQAKYPNAKVELVEHGVTEQNRPLVYLRVTSNTNTAAEKPIVVIESGINPREWVTIPAALNIVEQILGEQRYLNGLEWIVVPVLNPDGYEYTRDHILTYLRTLQAKYPNAKVELVEHGVTEQNRPLVYLRVTSNTNTAAEKPIVVIESGINPREWVTIPAALNIVEQILGEQRYLNGLEWIVVPVLNPDGYEYTRDHLRFWQKSRSTSSHMGHVCPGVNLNRNFDLDWLHFDSSSSPCSHVYGGIAPFSETETEMIRHIINSNGSKVKLYISLQNNGGYISYPWNFERAASGMFVQHHLLGLRMVNSMSEAYNLNIGSLIFDRASGTGSDYARYNGVLYTFNIDVVQSDNGVVIAEEDIGGIINDVWKAVAVAADEMIRLNV